ncbi:MerR family transcriptional regulator [Mucilaginibacter agri]|uniref:MerR family transcriptional regulator n=1 Tax=Mucilaginibacter agri TaxID=2695265 RepID=A0A966DTN6_9SPHI|nr:MerR family transcriptional regulator [Mucilaginibacter agri]NCD69532.1 MerR family transcriptional regulator [Mucilaginibacter agri]
MATQLAVKQLANLAGISVRTLHVYDKIGLLKPSIRTTAGYRLYGEEELLRLQQILFYKELDFPLKEIISILDDENFNLVNALHEHQKALIIRRNRLDTLLNTIDKTITNLKNKTMDNYEELYEGMPKEQITAIRNEAIEKWGENAVLRSEKALLEMPKMDINRLKAEQKDITNQLRFKFLAGQAPESEEVQEQIARHYANIRSFWGVSDPTDLKAAQYKGLAELYTSDERYITSDGKADAEFAAFLRRGMIRFADRMLR